MDIRRINRKSIHRRDKMELWDIYDEYRKKTGKTHQKGIKTKEGEYHIAVRVWIVNGKNELLLQQDLQY